MNRTLERGLKVVELVADNPEGLTQKDICEYLNLPKSSAFDLIQTLLALGYLDVSRYNEKKYVQGSQSYSTGMKYISNSNIIEACQLYLDPLADELHRNAFAGVLDKDKVLYIHKYVGNGAKLATCQLGTRSELYYTGLGKALLAFSDQKVSDKLIDNINFVRQTKYTIIDKNELKSELKKTRERGFAFDDREKELHMLCVSCPVYDSTNKMVAAISVSDMFSPDTDKYEIGKKLQEVANQISQKLGYSKRNY